VGDGGVTNSVRRLSAAMADEGARLVIAYQASDGPSPRDDRVTWQPVRHAGVAGIQVPLDLADVLAGCDMLILNSAWTAHNVRAGAIARAAGVPYVVADRGAYDPLILQRRRLLKDGWWRAFERRLVFGARAMHAFFPSQEQALRDLGYRGEVIVAPNGVQVPEGLRWDGGTGGYLLFVGRFDPEHKGLDLLLRAVASMPSAERPELRLHGPDWRGGKPRVVALIDELGLHGWAHVGSPVYGAEKWQLYTAAAGFVYPSRWEGFGNAPAEAAALGIPTLVTPYPLGRWFAEQGAAVLAEPDPASLARGLRTLLGPGASMIGRRAADTAQAFTWAAVARAWLTQMAALT
jgi:glycosyltransferase involved in cell wall biosynthesis